MDAAFEHEIVLLPKQREALTFLLEDESGEALKILALLGGWGSGKTTGCAAGFLAGCASSPWTPTYGSNNPRSALVAPNLRIARQSMLPPLDAIMPPEIVRRRRGQPFNDILLVNGHLIELHSAESMPEGQSYQHLWVDEIHNTSYNLQKYLNLQARARDNRTPRMTVIASGLPESGWLRDRFDREPTIRQKTILMATRDNPWIAEAVIAEFLAACPSGQEAALLGGQWMSAIGAIYQQFDPRVHVVDREIDPTRPVDVSFDVGDMAAVLFSQLIRVPVRNVVGQTKLEDALLVGGQMLPDGKSVDEICYDIRTRTNYNIVKGGSIICVDPTTDKDELLALHKHFPRVHVRRRERGDHDFPVKTGIRWVQRALRDSLGNVRLFFARSIAGQERGVVSTLPKYRWGPNGEPVKDNLEHALDALRYEVCARLPAERPAPTFVSG